MTIITENHSSKGRHVYPTFNPIDHLRNLCVAGDQSLGFVHTYRPDIYLITDQTHNRFHPEIVVPKIEHGLRQGKKVALFWYDEDFIVPNEHDRDLCRALESFRDEPVYLCSTMHSSNLAIYTSPTHRNLPIKVLWCPWAQLTVLCQKFLATANSFQGPDLDSNIQFACYVNRVDQFKQDCIDIMLSKNLETIGHFVVQGKALSNHERTILSGKPQDTNGWTSSHDMKKSLEYNWQMQLMVGYWFRNQQRLISMLGDIPLVIHPETNPGIFPLSDKFYWPVCGSRMVMLCGRQHLYREAAQITGFDFGCYLDLEFDSIEGWDRQAYITRLECMLDKNSYVIRHARDKWYEVQDKLRVLADDIPAKMYRHFCDALDQII